MIVVDTNIIAYLFLEGEFTSQAESLFHKETNWAAPVLWRSEFRNVLAHYLRKEICNYSGMRNETGTIRGTSKGET